jgi:hypothetical protein
VAAETITVPAGQTRLRVPNGQEVITSTGGDSYDGRHIGSRTGGSQCERGTIRAARQGAGTKRE